MGAIEYRVNNCPQSGILCRVLCVFSPGWGANDYTDVETTRMAGNSGEIGLSAVTRNRIDPASISSVATEAHSTTNQLCRRRHTRPSAQQDLRTWPHAESLEAAPAPVCVILKQCLNERVRVLL